MIKIIVCISIVITALAYAGDLGLPPHLEIIERDSTTITILDKNTGLVNTVVCEGEPKFGPGWELDTGGMTTDIADSCFYFWEIGWLPYMGYLMFGDADGDSLTEIIGKWGIYTFIYESTGVDGNYIKVDSLRRVNGIGYGADTDFDGLPELMTSYADSMTLFESADPYSLPTNQVFMWPWDINASTFVHGGFTDLDGDGITEISFRPNYMAIYMLDNTGDNDYELAHHISHPDSLLDNYYDYAWGDFDNDGKTEIVTCGMNGHVLTYEYSESDSFEFVWSDQVYRDNCQQIVGPTDMDNDGLPEFIVMARSYAMGGFYYFFYESIGDNQFEVVDIDSLPGDVWTGGSLELSDLDNDGIDELVVTSSYLIGIFISTGDNIFEPIYLIQEQSSHVWIYDTNLNGTEELVHKSTVGQGVFLLEFSPGLYESGDINGDCLINGLDVVYLVNYFKGYVDELPIDIYLADVNGDCSINGLDVSYFVSYLKGGSELIYNNCY